MKRQTVLSLGLTASLLLQSNAWLIAADPAPAQTTPAAGAVVPSRDVLIEVSVDTLEIKEINASQIGVLWGDNSSSVTNQFGFFERTIPSLFRVGSFDRNLLAAKLDALVRNNQARVLANPTLLTKPGFEANFLVGGEVPYPTVGQGGSVGVEFKKYGVALKILPQITPRNTIEAQINIGVSSIDDSVAKQIGLISVPGLSSREASSKVDVKDGETIVMAGIKQSRRSKTVTKVPLLGSIPLLGFLFRNTKEENEQTSLVVFVTFRMIKN